MRRIVLGGVVIATPICSLQIRKLKLMASKRTLQLVFTKQLLPKRRKFGSVPSKTHYDILGVKGESTAQDIRAAFYEKSKQVHPDMQFGKTNVSNIQDFIDLKMAYEVLSNDTTRAQYDNYLASIDKPKYSFDEWREHSKTNFVNTTGKEDYNMQHSWHDGHDMQWKDFTIWDISLIFVLAGMAIYVYRSQKQLNRIHNFRTKMHEPKYDQKALPYYVVPESQLQVDKNVADETKLDILSANSAFEEIAKTGQVSEETLNAIAKHGNQPVNNSDTEPLGNVRTWS